MFKIDNIVVGDNIVKSLLSDILKKYEKKFLITDENLRIYLNLFPDEVIKIVIPAGEKSKNFNSVFDIYNFLIENKATRESLIIALGGGVIGDIAGFVASTFKRGLKLIHIPTTLLAQIDSSIGGKTGVNYKGYKNLIGTFYNADKVIIDTSFLKTLSTKDFINGLGEVVKYGIIKGGNFWNFLVNNSDKILERNCEVLNKIIYECVKAKHNIVNQDPFDRKNIRIFLNLGHTIGHAIESIENNNLTHGEAVAIGISIIAEISYKLGMISLEKKEEIVMLLKRFNLPFEIPVHIDFGEICKKIEHDKKNTDSGIKLILIEDIGKLKVEMFKNIDFLKSVAKI